MLVAAGSSLLLGVPLPSPPALPSVPPLPKSLPTALPTLPPLPLPSSLPTALPTALPTSLPTGLPTSLPTSLPSVLPSGPPVLASPNPGPTGATPTIKPAANPAGRAVSSHIPGFGGWTIPAAALGEAIAIGLFFLPLLIGVWLLVFGRTVYAARLLHSAPLRLNVAADLGIRPRDLAAMDVQSLLRVRDEVAVDELTGALRRSAGVAAVERELARARRRKHALVAAFIDVDGLKKLNDTEGHSAGDALLQDVASILRSRLRADDVIFRYGGDEFVCVLPESGLLNATAVFEEMLVSARARGRSFSYGLAMATHGDDAVSLLGRADEALYASREAEAAAGRQLDWRGGRRRPISA